MRDGEEGPEEGVERGDKAPFTRAVVQGPSSSCAAQDLEPLYGFNEEIGNQTSLFGGVSTSMLTLFVCVTEGCGIDIVRPIVSETPTLAVFWLVFVFVTTFGVLIVIFLVLQISGFILVAP